MNAPDPSNWGVKAPGSNLFVLSDLLIQELEFIRQKDWSKEKIDSRDKAGKAIKSLVSLFQKGTITNGIPVNAGWAIGVPSPKKNDLEPELEQLDDIVKAFKRSDTKLLLLTKECHQLFESIPVTLVTGESNLFNAVQMQGVPCHLCSTFPIEGLKEASAMTKPVDWEQIINEIQSDTKQRAVEVELTLTAQGYAPEWLTRFANTTGVMVAEGHGVVRVSNDTRPFLWKVFYYSQTIGLWTSNENKEKLPDLPTIHIDFQGYDVDQDLFDDIADRLVDCANIKFEEGTPTLQSLESIIETLFFLDYTFENAESVTSIENTKEALRKEIRDSEGWINYYTNAILNIEDENDRFAHLNGFIQAINDCWKIGQTYKFSFIPNKQPEMES